MVDRGYRGQPWSRDEASGPSKHRVLVVAQTPPPYHGQAISTQRFLDGEYEGIELIPLRLSFSRSIGEVNRLVPRKFFHLFAVVGRILFWRLWHGVRVLYYLPSGNRRGSMYRDVLLLGAVRWFFPTIIFHFRSAGLSDLFARLTLPEKILFRLAYDRPALGIQLSAENPPDAATVRAKRSVVVPNGLEDMASAAGEEVPARDGFNILYIGTVRESKGVMDLLRAFRLLADHHSHVRLTIVGEFRRDSFRRAVRDYVVAEGLEGRVAITGPLYGEEKWARFREADVLCFPSYFQNESFGNVMVEAMQFRLPVVATRWRASPTVVEDGGSGFLVEVRSPEALAERLERLVLDPGLARSMGHRGRKRYEESFTVDHFGRNMERVILETLEPERVPRTPRGGGTERAPSSSVKAEP